MFYNRAFISSLVAKPKGGFPSTSFALTFVPLSNRIFTISLCPFSAAKCKGGFPLSSTALTLTPSLIRRVTSLVLPILAALSNSSVFYNRAFISSLVAKPKGGFPSTSFALTFVPLSNRIFTISLCPFSAAKCKGGFPLSSTALTLTPSLIRRVTSLVLPILAALSNSSVFYNRAFISSLVAKPKGGFPSTSFALTFVPLSNRIFTISLCPFSAAKCKGGFPLSSTALTLTPSLIRRVTSLVLPILAALSNSSVFYNRAFISSLVAKPKGGFPSTSFALTFVPLSNRIFTISLCPFSAAKCKGGFPLSSTALTLTPSLIRRVTSLVLPILAALSNSSVFYNRAFISSLVAKPKGGFPSTSFALTFVPLSNRIFTISLCPFSAAKCKGGFPLSSTALTLTPSLIRRVTSLVLPILAALSNSSVFYNRAFISSLVAKPKGGFPSTSFALTFVPLSNRIFTISLCPFSAAKCKGGFPLSSTALTLTPSLIRRVTSLVLPILAALSNSSVFYNRAFISSLVAKPKGGFPSTSFALTFVPLSNRIFTISL
ncbi:hypothetical protein [Wolbachia endosymbiont of Nilaparvata lugens]